MSRIKRDAEKARVEVESKLVGEGQGKVLAAVLLLLNSVVQERRAYIPRQLR